MKRLSFLPAALSLSIAVMLFLVQGAYASGPAPQPGPAAMKLNTAPSLDGKGHKIKGQLLLVVTLTAADGTALNNETVDFYEQVTFVGSEREAKLGTATTDSTGRAAIAYRPSQTGPHTLVARFAGDQSASKTDITSTIKVSDVVPPFAPQAAPLASVRQWMTVGVAMVVVGVWMFLFGILLRVILGIRAAARVPVVSGEIPEYLRTSQGD